MNFLLQDLVARGVMKHPSCIAFSDMSIAKRILALLKDRAVMDMGDKTRPGPYWAVRAEDVDALVAAGYKVVIRQDDGSSDQPDPIPPLTM